MSKQGVRNFVHALIAVLAGNAVYFLLMPHLPPAAQHDPTKTDLGLVVDFWFCLVAFGIVKTAAGRKQRNSEKHQGH